MSDEAWRAHERRWRQEPSDQDALGRAIAGMRRSGLVVPADLLDARIEPATALETTLPLEVWAVLPGDREPTTVGWGPGRVEVPPHRYWGVGDVPAGLEGLGVLGDELRSRAIPGLRLPQLAPSRQRPDPQVDGDALAALGAQPQLRWLELPRDRSQPATPGQVVQALRCTGLEVFRGESLGVPEAPARLEGFEELLHLRELELTDCRLVAGELSALGRLDELEALELPGSGSVGFADLARLGCASRLRRVRVETTTAADLAHAASLERLQAVWVDWVWLDGCVEQLLAIRGLRELTMGGPNSDMLKPSDDTFRRLADRPLTRLALHRHLVGPSALESLGTIPTLTALTGKSLFVTPSGRGLSALAGCQRLEELQVRFMQGGCGAELSSFPHLRRLRMDANPDPALGPALSGLQRLEEVSLRAAGHGPMALTCPALRTLELHGRLDHSVIDLRSSNLRQLQLPGVGDVWIGQEAGLEGLSISSPSTDEELARLSSFVALRALTLAPSPDVADLVVDRVERIARSLPSLRRLMISRASWDVPTELLGAIQERLAALPGVALVDDDLSRSREP